MELVNENKKNGILTKKVVLLFVITGGLSVATLYYSQPLLAEISKTFHNTPHNTGLISTFTQLGYALGIFLFVPLGDVKEKRKLILVLVSLVTLSLLGVALAQTLIWMYIASFTVGLTAISSQIMIPLANRKIEEK